MSDTQKAFERSVAGYELDGKPLPHRFQAMRQGAAAAMGLRFGLVDEADIFTVHVADVKKKKKHDLQFYNQLFSDVVIVLWLCSVSDVKVLRALRKPDEAKAEAFSWADSRGMALTSDAYFSASSVFFQIMQDITVSTGVPRETSETAEDDDPND